MAVCGSCDAREWRENTQQGTLADRGGVSLRGPSVAGWPDGQGEDSSSEGLGGHDLLTQADAGRTLIARMPGRPNRNHFPKEDFHIDQEAGACTCPAGNVTRRIRPSGTRTGPDGRTHQLKGFRFDAAVCGVCPLRSQ